jgi:hypothetical protein
MIPIILLFVLASVGKIVTLIEQTVSGDESPLVRTMTRLWVGFSAALILVIGAEMFTPTTKELAAIIVVPKIANSTLVTEKIPQELSELYTLAKQYMIESLKEKKKEAEK